MGIFDNGTGNLGYGDVVDSLSNAAKNGAQIISGLQTVKSPNPVPWSAAGGFPVNSPFYTYVDIDPNRWNQLYPYRLLVIDTSQGNRLVGNFSTNSTVKIVTPVGQGTPTLIFEPLGYNWVFNLPITPQQMSIVDQFAINTSATLRGVVEEHNGIKFKMISASGTMGVWPYRESVSKAPGSAGILQSVLGGTIQAASGLISQVVTTVNSFTNNYPVSKPSTISPTDLGSQFGGSSTGYYQAMYLQQFLEQYAEAKKDPKNYGWRLVFDIPKQNQSFVVTPMQFTWQQSVNRPMEITYQMQFKAWRRINLNEVPQKPSPAQAYTVTPGILQRVLASIMEARLICSSAIAVIGAVRSDVDGVFNVLRQTALFVKDALGVIATASDLPSSIQQDFASATQAYTAQNAATILGAVTTAAGAAAAIAIKSGSNRNNGLSTTAVSGGALGPTAANAQQVSNATSVTNNPNSNVDLFDQVPVNELALNAAQQKKLNQILSNTSLTVTQLKNNANVLLTLTVQLSDYYGAGNALYNSTYGLTPPPTLIQPMTINQYLILDVLYEAIQGINFLTATTQVTDVALQNSLEFIAGLANQSNITFNIPTSKVIVPVPYNANIEQIAARYLGDATRWLEIATLNNLEEPYIDENGFQLTLLSNAIGRQVIVSSNANLYLGQTVILKSSTQIQVARNITNITPLPNGNGYLLTLNGEPNLGIFVTADGAYVQAYLPNTTNSQQKIFIPSDLAPPTYPGQLNILPPSVAASDPLTGLSGTDLLLTDDGDLALNSYGDFLISYGLTNLIQALRILFTTTLNSFLIHPEYGLGVQPGTSISDLNVQELFKQINSQVTQDPRFASVTSLQIQANPPNLTISLGVSLPNMQGTLPVSFQLAA